MTNSETIINTRLTVNLLTAVSIHHSPEVADSVVDRFGDLRCMSRWEQEEMNDDLISKLNDTG